MKLFLKQSSALLYGQFFACAALFAVPINKPATNICIALALLCSFFAPQALQRYRWSLSQTIVRGALIWLAVLLVRHMFSIYQGASVKEYGTSSFFALIYPLIYGALLTNSQTLRRYALYSFGAAVVLVLCASWLRFWGVLSTLDLTGAMQYTVFKEYTQQGLEIMVLAAMTLTGAMTSTNRGFRWLCFTLATMAIANIIFVTPSRTSLLTLLPFLLLFGVFFLYQTKQPIKKYGWLGLGIILLGAAVLWSGNVSERLIKGLSQEITQYQEQHLATSTGARLEMWKQTTEMVQEKPWFGHGIGVWNNAFNQRVGEDKNQQGFLNFGHPHQEMLLVAFETGIIGLAIWVLLLIGLLRYCLKLPMSSRYFYTGVLLIYITAGLGNGLWSDFTHRHMFILLLACIPLVKNPQSTLSFTQKG